MHARIVISNVFKEKKLNTYLSGTRKKRLSRLGWLSFMVSSNSKIRWHQNPRLWFKCIGWLPESITTGDQGDILWWLLVELRRAQYPISESLTAHDLGYVFPHSFLFTLYPMLWLLQQLRAIISKATIYLDLFYLCIVSFFSFKSYSPTPKNLPTRNWHLKMALLATAEGSLGKRDGCPKPSYIDREQNSNNKPKVWKTSGGWTKRVILKI